jgi:hypothetical protein
MIQLTPHGVRTEASRVEKLRAEFAARHSAMLPGFFAPSLQEYLLKHVAQAGFVPKSENAGAYEFGRTLFLPRTETAWYLLHLLVNNPMLFRLVEQITGCARIGNFYGRIHRSLPGGEHRIDWHDDIHDDLPYNRLVGLNLSLSAEEFTGGQFQLREKGADHAALSVGRLPAGDAFLFRISPRLEHRLTPLETGPHRIVAVGWFRAQPEWQTFSKTLTLR